ncbi:MAG: hypothetical protein EZS28_043804 [Streblomastix strix]|uniref:Uncharacterized protein n=1 Tax=Streblomastix strix TaxID=222440 RepID=A0A5J4TRS9_9EUKA|nr:MAG: hypothetical protein EZS28_043804 [Streblomastix strix]
MQKDIEVQRNQLDIDNFEQTLDGVLDPVELWLITSDLRDSEVSCSSEALRMVKDSCDEGYCQKPSGILLAEAASCSPPLVACVWNGNGYQKVEIKESAIFTPEEELKLLAKILHIIDNTGFVTAQEI